MRNKKGKRIAVTMLCGCLLGTSLLPAFTPDVVKAAEAPGAQWEEISSVVSRYYGEWNDTSYEGASSDKMPNTAILGNGDVGVTSIGNSISKGFMISKGDFWTYKGNPLPVGSVTIGPKQAEAEEETGTNLAPKNKSVTASSQHDNFKPQDAVSGKVVPSADGYGWVSNVGKGAWLQLEFEEPITIARYVVKSDAFIRKTETANTTSDFQLQVSADGTEWKDADCVEGNDQSVFDKNLEEAVTAKYVRLYITKPTQETTDDSRKNPRARIVQFELYPERKEDNEENPNLALNRPVKVCCHNIDGAEQKGELMVDGDPDTKWCAVHNDNTPHWAIIDLGEDKTIGYYKLLHSGTVGEHEHNTRDYELQYLTDDEAAWENIENIGQESDPAVTAEDDLDTVEEKQDEPEKKADADTVSGNDIKPVKEAQDEPIQKEDADIEEETKEGLTSEEDVDTAPEEDTGIEEETQEELTQKEDADIEEEAKEGLTSKEDADTAPEEDTGIEKEMQEELTQKEDVDTAAEENSDKIEKALVSSAEWHTLDKVTGNKADTTAKVLEKPVRARYIRLWITKADGSNKAARIHELELRESKPESEVGPVDFHEKQDILNAEIQTEQTLANIMTEMTTWLSADRNLLVTELTSRGEKDAEIQVDVQACTNGRPVSAAHDDKIVTVTRSTINDHQTESDSYTSEAALSTKIIGADDVETISYEGEGKGILKFTLRPGATVYVVTAIGGGGRTYNNRGELWERAVKPAEEARTLLGEVTDEEKIQNINSERLNWWKDFWSRSYIDFGTSDEKLNKIQKYYYGAQYILGSTTREGKLAPGLYGIWHTTDNASWHSDYHLNYNFISAFYGTNSSNRPELSLPGVEALLSFVPEGQRRASSITELRRINVDFVNKKIEKGDISETDGISGAILFPVGIGPWGTVTDDVYLNEALDAAYNSYIMTQYYEYTMDEEFLKAGAYDYMKQAVAFYETWLEKEEYNGDYRYVLYAGYNEGSWAINPAVELAALKSTLRHLIDASETLGRDADKRAKWEDIYTHLGEQPTTEVNGKTVLALGEKEWKNGKWQDLISPIPRDGNAIPLDAIIPGGVYTYYSSPEDLEIVHNTIDVFAGNGAWSQINNYPRLFPDAVKTRYSVDTIVDALYSTIQRQMVANMRINDNAHGVEKSGATEAINSMMLISDEGITKLFPNWFADKNAKFAGLRAKGAFVVSAEYDGTIKEAKNISITSEAGKDMTIVSPWPGEAVVVRDSSGRTVRTTAGAVENWPEEKTITFATKKGETYYLAKAGQVDKSQLEALLSEAKEIDLSGYTEDSVERFRAAYAAAKKLWEDASLTEAEQEAVDQAVAALRAARESLTVKDSSGETGDTENNGNTGETGDTGNSGNNGNTGNSGNNGNTGNSGNNGNTGNSGNIENTGNTENSGNTEIAENTGNRGNAGNIGRSEAVQSTSNTADAGTETADTETAADIKRIEEDAAPLAGGEKIEDNGKPSADEVKLEEEETPLAGGTTHWTVLTLVLVLIIVGLGFAGVYKRRKSD